MNQKTAEIAADIARRLIAIPVGERLPTVGELSRQYHVGFGTVHKVLRQIEERGAVQLEVRGHLGTVLAAKNLDALWRLSGHGTLIGALPLPTSREYRALASGLYAEFRGSEIPFDVVFINGGRKRLDLVGSGRFDFAVVSATAAQRAQAETPGFRVFRRLAPGSYYAPDSMVVIAAPHVEDKEQIGVIGIDPSSIDHALLSRAEFRDRPVRTVECSYENIPELVAAGELDGAVWHRTSAGFGDTDALRVYPLGGARPVAAAMSEACLVTHDKAPEVAVVLSISLQASRLEEYLLRVAEQRIVSHPVAPEARREGRQPS